MGFVVRVLDWCCLDFLVPAIVVVVVVMAVFEFLWLFFFSLDESMQMSAGCSLGEQTVHLLYQMEFKQPCSIVCTGTCLLPIQITIQRIPSNLKMMTISFIDLCTNICVGIRHFAWYTLVLYAIGECVLRIQRTFRLQIFFIYYENEFRSVGIYGFWVGVNCLPPHANSIQVAI